MRSKLFPALLPSFVSVGFPHLHQAGILSSQNRSLFASNEDESIEAQRRRRSDGPQGRADAPARRREDSGGSRDSQSGQGGGGYPTGGGGSSFGGGGLGGLKLPPWAIVLLLIGFVIYYLVSGGTGGTPADTQPVDTAAVPSGSFTQDTPIPAGPTLTAAPSFTPPPAGSASTGKTWTVMLYQDADDKVLEEDIMTDLNEAERVGSSDRVKIVVQIDRYRGAYTGDGNWDTARRYLITRDNDLTHLSSKVVSELGEVNMADPQTLVDFASWAIKTYPADNYALILSDHGMGWPGGWSDQSPNVTKSSSIPLVKAAGNVMYLMEIDNALAEIRRQTGLSQFEFIGMDACLMSDVAVYTALAPHAHYAVASQETEPALGWAYTSFLQSLSSNPDMNGGQLGQMVVKSYITDDQRIVDDQARAAFMRAGSPLSGFGVPSAQQLAGQISRSVTLTAADLSVLPEVNDRLNKLAFALQSENQSLVAKARTYAQSFTSIFGQDVPPSYIDLGNFTAILQKEGARSEVQSAASALQAALKKFVVAEKHGPDKAGATGVSIYFPNSQLYGNAAAGPSSYNPIAKRFVEQSLWDDFLAFHYSQRPFEVTAARAAAPAANSRLVVPGAGKIEIASLTLSASEAAPEKPVTLTAALRGTNIGYVYLFVGYLDKAANSIQVADIDYLQSPQTRQVGGLYYPVWSDNESFNLVYKWNPTVFEINDGNKSATAALEPESYGATAEETVYTVGGYYQPADGGAASYARLYFQNMQLKQVFTFTGDNQSGAPHEVIPQNGDTFTVLEKWMDIDSSGKLTPATQKGTTLTFGSQPWTWKELYAAVGDYVVGFFVSDMDGNSTQAYKPVTVR